MVLNENPTCNSVRIQRALRLNNIEQYKLQHQIGLLDKECTRHVRLHNQDMRIVNLTMDYVGTSSGYSPEGLSPEEEAAGKFRNEVDFEMSSCFMYGERLNSRRFGKNRRTRSAVSKSNYQTRKFTNDEEDDEGDDLSTKIRPLSSPPKKQRGQFITQGPAPASARTDSTDIPRPRTAFGEFSSQDSPSMETPEPRQSKPTYPSQSSKKRIAFSMAGQEKTSKTPRAKTPSVAFSQDTKESSDINIPQRTSAKPSRQGLPNGRSSTLTQAVSKARVMATNARSKMKHSILNVWIGPVTPKTTKQKEAMEAHKLSARAHTASVNQRLENFNKKYPLPRSLVLNED